MGEAMRLLHHEAAKFPPGWYLSLYRAKKRGAAPFGFGGSGNEIVFNDLSHEQKEIFEGHWGIWWYWDYRDKSEENPESSATDPGDRKQIKGRRKPLTNTLPPAGSHSEDFIHFDPHSGHLAVFANLSAEQQALLTQLALLQLRHVAIFNDDRHTGVHQHEVNHPNFDKGAQSARLKVFEELRKVKGGLVLDDADYDRILIVKMANLEKRQQQHEHQGHNLHSLARNSIFHPQRRTFRAKVFHT
ncbi:hypothetical protein T439DRAFT_359857 [Meredithblackwellia eburnea MCA 4105]